MLKKIIKLFLIMFVSFTFIQSTFALSNFNNYSFISDIDYTTDYNRDDDMSTNCQDFAPALKVVGIIIVIAKIAIPLIIIIKASMNFFSTVVKGDPGEFKKQAQKLGVSFVAAIIVFFLPIVVDTIFGFIDGFVDNKTSDSEICRACLFDPYDETCTKYADKAGN